MPQLLPFIAPITESCPSIRSVWRTGYCAQTELLDSSRPHDLELVAFADEAALQYLRNAESLHRRDVRLLVVTDGNRFESAWGDTSGTGSMLQWNWRQANEHEAYYFETRVVDGVFERIRRKASCAWRWAPVVRRKTFAGHWRPDGDSNPGYRRERAMS